MLQPNQKHNPKDLTPEQCIRRAIQLRAKIKLKFNIWVEVFFTPKGDLTVTMKKKDQDHENELIEFVENFWVLKYRSLYGQWPTKLFFHFRYGRSKYGEVK